MTGLSNMDVTGHITVLYHMKLGASPVSTQTGLVSHTCHLLLPVCDTWTVLLQGRLDWRWLCSACSAVSQGCAERSSSAEHSGAGHENHSSLRPVILRTDTANGLVHAELGACHQ